RAHINGNYDYSYSSHLPLGMNIEVFNAKALLAFSEKADLTNEDREHVTYYFSRTNHYRTFYPKLSEENMTGRIRLTMDYPADYAVLNLVTQIAEQTNLSGMQLVHHVDVHYPWIWN